MLDRVEYQRRMARMGETDTDQALVERVQQGDKRAFDLLIRKYQHKLISVISRYVSDWSECQDVAQDPFIRAYHPIAAFRASTPFHTYTSNIPITTPNNY